MAALKSSSRKAIPISTKIEHITIFPKTHSKLSRRELTLLAITILLHTLLWSSLMIFSVTVFQLVSDLEDTTNLASELLTLISSIATFAYILLHIIFSLKQRAWKHQGQRPFIEKTSYVAARFAVTLCILWLVTTGWNMVMIARQPFCLPQSLTLQVWEAGPTCHANRIGVAFSTIALIASFTLFYMLSTVRRPFEAHLFKHGYKPSSTPNNLTPGVSRHPSPSLSPSSLPEKHYTAAQGSVSANFQNPSFLSSTTEIETLDLNSTTSSAVRISLGIFTSLAQPPPLPPAFTSSTSTQRSSTSFIEPHRPSSLFLLSPTATPQHLPNLPRYPPGFVPIPIPTDLSAQNAPSTIRAVHPLRHQPSTHLRRHTASRSSTHLPTTNTHNTLAQYKSHYHSRSSISLTRPHRLSGFAPPSASTTPSSCSGAASPRSASTAATLDGEGLATRRSASETGLGATAEKGGGLSGEISRAVVKGVDIPRTGMGSVGGTTPSTSKEGTKDIAEESLSRGRETEQPRGRRARALDVTCGGQQQQQQQQHRGQSSAQQSHTTKGMTKSASLRWRERSVSRWGTIPRKPLRRSVDSQLRPEGGSGEGAVQTGVMRSARGSAEKGDEHRGWDGLGMESVVVKKKTFEEVKNKELPRIAVF